MYICKTLKNTEPEILHQAFVEAFSDYQIKMDLPFWKFQQMLNRRGFVPELSMGAFVNDELVGFILNGYRIWNNKSTVYDLGTGVIGEYRKQGITTKIFNNLVVLLKERNVDQYLLEVLTSNTSAIRLYTKQGFKISRDFECFQLEKRNYYETSHYNAETVTNINPEEWKHLITFWDFQPSWQNSVDSINAASDTFFYSIVRIDNNIVGYGIIDKKTGDIPHLAVDKHYRHKGIGRSILIDLMKNTEADKVSILNVDIQYLETNNFLLALGFIHIIGQHEMILNL